MRRLSLAICLIVPLAARAQTPAIQQAVDELLVDIQRQETLKYILSLHDPVTGGYRSDTAGKPSYRACNSASKVITYLDGKVQPDREKTAAFILSCYDPATGTFAEPGGKADVGSTAVGVITAAEFKIPHEKYAKAMQYLKDNSKSFDDLRIAAAAVEAFGKDDSTIPVGKFLETAKEHVHGIDSDAAGGGAREMGSAVAMSLRLGAPIGLSESAIFVKQIRLGQRDDGGWGKKDAKASDPESNYRVMRALYLLKEKPTEPAKLRGLIAKYRNADGGYGVEPGKPSNISGTYYAITVLHWLAELEAK
jgi:hypothetical protein